MNDHLKQHNPSGEVWTQQAEGPFLTQPLKDAVGDLGPTMALQMQSKHTEDIILECLLNASSAEKWVHSGICAQTSNISDMDNKRLYYYLHSLPLYDALETQDAPPLQIYTKLYICTFQK